jgi:hypothetical protein
LPGHLALAETGHPDLLREALVGGVDGRLQGVFGYLDAEFYAVFFDPLRERIK